MSNVFHLRNLLKRKKKEERQLENRDRRIGNKESGIKKEKESEKIKVTPMKIKENVQLWGVSRGNGPARVPSGKTERESSKTGYKEFRPGVGKKGGSGSQGTQS